MKIADRQSVSGQGSITEKVVSDEDSEESPGCPASVPRRGKPVLQSPGPEVCLARSGDSMEVSVFIKAHREPQEQDGKYGAGERTL